MNRDLGNAMKESWKSVRLGSALIVLLTLVAYIPAMRGGFIWDDHTLITDNPLIKSENGLYRFWFTTEATEYYPVTWSLWWLEWRLWGNNAAGYHVVNVLLHAINAVLVWVILKRLRIHGAWLAGLVFAIHPVNVATVAWISEQKNTLSMLFYIVTILLYLRFDEEGRWRWYGFSLAAFLLTLLIKTAVVMLPFVLLGCVWWMRGRVRRKDFLCSVPFFAFSLVMGIVNIWFEYHRASGGNTIRTAGFMSRLAAAGLVPWFYLYKAIVPFNLNAIYPIWNVNASLWVSYLPGLVLVGCLTLFWWKRNGWGRPLFFGLGYFVIMLFPVLGFFDQPFYLSSMVSDHWQYYSVVGAIALTIAAGVALCRRTSERGRYVWVLASVTVLMMLGESTWTRAGVWGDPEALWRDTLTKNPNAWAAHYNLGVSMTQAGRIEDAIGHYEQALRLKPDNAKAHYNLGVALTSQGKTSEAIAEFVAALKIEPNYAEAYCNLGAALANQGKASEAIDQYEQALRIKPDNAEAHYNLGIALASQGKIPEAIYQYEQALRIRPDYAKAHNNLGLALASQDKVSEAISEFAAAAQIEPDYAEAHCNLGVALTSQGRISEAITQYREAVRLKPDLASALYGLAWILATDGNANLRNASEAVQLGERLCALTGFQDAEDLDVLAAAYAEAGRFSDATRIAQKAIELANAAGQQELLEHVQERLKLYQNGQPFHEGSASATTGA